MSSYAVCGTRRRLLLAAVLTVLAAGPQAHADDESGESEKASLAERSTDPTQSPMSIQFKGALTTSYYELADGTELSSPGYDFVFRPVIPVKLFGANNILRLTVPYHIDGGAGNAGLDDVTIFDLVILPLPKGRLGVGAVANLASREKDVSGHASTGPAVGAVVPVAKGLNVGLFTQNFFGDGIATTTLQPIVAYELGGGFSLALGELLFSYDWEQSQLLTAPVGLEVGKVLQAGAQAIRVTLSGCYNLDDTAGTEEGVVTLGLELIAE